MKSIFDITVSGFRDVEAVSPRPVTLKAWLTSSKHRQKVELIRSTQDEVTQKLLKKDLPAITPAGTFSYRNKKSFLEHSGFMAFDIDFQNNKHISNFTELKDQLKNIKNIAYCGLSVRGNGFWGLVRIPKSSPEAHELRFEALRIDFARFNIVLDPQGHEVNRLRIYSWDPDAYFNEDATVYTKIHKPQPKPAPKYNRPTTGDNKEKVEKILSNLNGIDITGNYHQWFSIGCALANEFAESGRVYFHEVSQYYSGYDPRETDRQFDYCLKHSYSYDIATFFYHAESHGIRFKDAPEVKLMNTEELKELANKEIGNFNHVSGEDLLKLMSKPELKKLIDSGFIKEARPLEDKYYLNNSTPF